MSLRLSCANSRRPSPLEPVSHSPFAKVADVAFSSWFVQSRKCSPNVLQISGCTFLVARTFWGCFKMSLRQKKQKQKNIKTVCEHLENVWQTFATLKERAFAPWANLRKHSHLNGIQASKRILVRARSRSQTFTKRSPDIHQQFFFF